MLTFKNNEILRNGTLEMVNQATNHLPYKHKDSSSALQNPYKRVSSGVT